MSYHKLQYNYGKYIAGEARWLRLAAKPPDVPHHKRNMKNKESFIKKIKYNSEVMKSNEFIECLYKANLKFQFTKKDVIELLEKAEAYSEEIRNRVETIIFAQMRKYAYLFSAV